MINALNLYYDQHYQQDTFIKKERKDDIQLDMKRDPDKFSAFVTVIDVIPFDEYWSFLVLERGNPIINPNFRDMQDLLQRFTNDINSIEIIYEDFKQENLVMTMDNKIKITDLCGLQYQRNWHSLCNGKLFSSWSASNPHVTNVSLDLAKQTMYFSIMCTYNIKKENMNKFEWRCNWKLKNNNPEGFTEKLLDICENKNNNLAILLRLLIKKEYMKFQLHMLKFYHPQAYLVCKKKTNVYVPSKKKRKPNSID